MSKFHNRNVEIDGIKFDSLAEGRYYEVLKLRQKAGDIERFEVHPKIMLVPAFVSSDGEKVRAITIIPEFCVMKLGKTIFADCKGGKATQTIAWRIKWKLLKWAYRDMKNYEFEIVE